MVGAAHNFDEGETHGHIRYDSRYSAAVARSSRVAVKDAVAEVADRAHTGVPAKVVIAYSGVAYDQERLIAALCERYPGVPVVGCSTQGFSMDRLSLESDRFLVIAELGGSDLAARSAHVEDLRPDPYAAGRALADQLGPVTRADQTTLLWYDPLGGADVQATLRGLADGGCPIVYGGAAGQPWGHMVETYQYADGRAMTRGAVAMRIEGPTLVGDFTHGAESLGLELTVTLAEGNIIRELDGKPALDLWCEQLGVSPEREVENTSNWALGVRPPDGVSYEGLVTRAPFGLDPAQKTLILQAPIPTGSRVQVCIRTQSAVYDGAMAMGERLGRALVGRNPLLALSFECGARPAPFLGTEAARQEVIEVQRRLACRVPWFGMYAWGEIAPVGPRSDFHNFTFPLGVLCVD